MSRGLRVALLIVAVTNVPARADKTLAQDHYKRGMAAFVLEDWNTAAREFELGFREEPKPDFLYNIAQSHYRAGHKERALVFYRKFLDMRPDARDRGEVEGVIVELEHALGLSPGAPVPQTEPLAMAAPTPTSEPVKPPLAAHPSSDGELTPAFAETPPASKDAPPPARTRPWVIALGVAAGVIIVGVGIAGVAASQPSWQTLPAHSER